MQLYIMNKILTYLWLNVLNSNININHALYAQKMFEIEGD